MAVKTSQVIEIALPSGIFARIRPLTMLDRMIADLNGKSAESVFAKTAGDERAGLPMMIPALIARCVLFDDKTFTIEEVLAMDARDTEVLCCAMLPYLKGPIT